MLVISKPDIMAQIVTNWIDLPSDNTQSTVNENTDEFSTDVSSTRKRR